MLLLTPIETPALDDGEEGGVRLWHLVKAREESELPKKSKGSVRERGGERAKAIPEIYLTRLLSMKVKALVMLTVSEDNVSYTVDYFHH